jgi:hypothetical protein
MESAQDCEIPVEAWDSRTQNRRAAVTPSVQLETLVGPKGRDFILYERNSDRLAQVCIDNETISIFVAETLRDLTKSELCLAFAHPQNDLM